MSHTLPLLELSIFRQPLVPGKLHIFPFCPYMDTMSIERKKEILYPLVT